MHEEATLRLCFFYNIYFNLLYFRSFVDDNDKLGLSTLSDLEEEELQQFEQQGDEDVEMDGKSTDLNRMVRKNKIFQWRSRKILPQTIRKTIR
jgi:hypothetical protein